MLFTQTDDPNFVQSADGSLVPTYAVDPADIAPAVNTAPISLPAAAPEAAPAAPATAPQSAASPAVAAAEAKLDNPSISPLREMVKTGVHIQRGFDTSGMQADNTERATDLGNAYKDAAKKKYELQAGLAEKVMDKTAIDIADAAKEQAQAAARREQARKQELAIRDQKDPELDPDQFMRENGIGMVLLAGISGALGAFSKNGGDNGAAILKAIDRRIDLNIAAQKEQINSGRIRRGNLIDYYVKQGLDAKEAESAAKALYYAKSADYVQQNKDYANLADGPANADLMAKTLLSQAAKENQSLEIAGQDKVSEAYGRPVAKKVDLQAAIKKQADTKEALEKSGASEEVQRAAWAAGGTGLPFPTGKSEFAKKESRDEAKLNEEKNKKNEDQGKAQAAWDSIDAYGKALGFQDDPEHEHTYRIPSGVSGNLNLKAGVENVKGAFGEAKPIEAARRVAVEALGRLASGGVIGKDELPGFKAMIGEGMSLKQIATNLNAIRTFIAPRMKDFHLPAGEESGSETASTPKSWE